MLRSPPSVKPLVDVFKVVFLSAVVRPLPACHFVGDGGQRIQPWVSVAQRLVSAKPGLNFNPSLFVFSFSKAFSPIIFSIIFRAFNYQIVGGRIEPNLLFALLYPS